MGQGGGGGLPEDQVQPARRIAPQREAIVQRIGGAAAAFDRHPVAAGGGRGEAAAVLAQRVGAPDRMSLRVEQAETAVRVGGSGLQVQPVARGEIDPVQRRLRAGFEPAGDRHVGAQRHGRVGSDQLEGIAARAIAHAIDRQRVGAGMQVQEAVSGVFDRAEVERVARARPLQLPLHLRAPNPVEQETGGLGQREPVAVLLAGLVDGPGHLDHTGQRIGRQQQLGFQTLDAPWRRLGRGRAPAVARARKRSLGSATNDGSGTGTHRRDRHEAFLRVPASPGRSMSSHIL